MLSYFSGMSRLVVVVCAVKQFLFPIRMLVPSPGSNFLPGPKCHRVEPPALTSCDDVIEKQALLVSRECESRQSALIQQVSRHSMFHDKFVH